MVHINLKLLDYSLSQQIFYLFCFDPRQRLKYEDHRRSHLLNFSGNLDLLRIFVELA